ncbi:flavin reductase [Peptostreptococcaceae bacterium oral taxon 113 str. W5053]|nr:flavin reductase [Peptostreptococcaceae bacterium oral taxon 113 str. W5053]
MKIVALNGSPRLRGNTYLLLEKALDTMRPYGANVKLISLSDKFISPCKGCYGCVVAKECIVKDDFQEIYEHILDADGLMLGSPVYHSCITPYLKSVLDRTGFSSRWRSSLMKKKNEYYTWANSPLSGKVVAPVTVARRAGQNFAFAELLLWASANDCIIIGNTYWNVAIAGKGGSIGIDEDLEGISIMHNIGERMVNLISLLKRKDSTNV